MEIADRFSCPSLYVAVCWGLLLQVSLWRSGCLNVIGCASVITNLGKVRGKQTAEKPS